MELKTKYLNLVKNVGIFAISNFAIRVISFVILPLYTYYLSKAEYAIVDLVNTTVQLLLPFLSLCVVDALLRFGMSNEYKKETIFTNSVVVIACGCLFLPLTLIAFKQFGQGELEGMEVYFLLIYVLQVFNNLFSAFCKTLDKIKQMAVISTIMSVVIIGLNVLFIAVMKQGIMGYLNALVIGNVLGLLLHVYVCMVPKYFKKKYFDKRILRDMLMYSIPLIPNAFFWWINTSLNKYMLTGMTTLSILGLYAVANKIPMIISTFTSIFSQAWNISAFQTYNDDDREAFYNNTYVLYKNLLLIGTSVVILLSEVFARFLFSKEFFAAWVFVPILTIGVYYSSLSGYLGSLFTANKQTKYIFYTTAMGAIVNLLLNLVLIRKYEAQGAAIATLCSFFIVWLVRSIVLHKMMQFQAKCLKEILSFAILLILSFLVLYDNRITFICAMAITVVFCFLNARTMYVIIKNRNSKS